MGEILPWPWKTMVRLPGVEIKTLRYALIAIYSSNPAQFVN